MAGLFGGVLGMERTFILHANGAKLPTDLLGLTCVRYGDATSAAEVKAVNKLLRKVIEDMGGLSRIEGLWWQFSMTERSTLEPSAVSLLPRTGSPSRTPDGPDRLSRATSDRRAGRQPSRLSP
jgi:hypothetical protein